MKKSRTIAGILLFVFVMSVSVSAATLTGSNNAWKVYNYLKNNGYTREAAAGVVGNLAYESGGITDIKLNAVEFGSGAGVGMCQWTGVRRTYFTKYCEDRKEPWPRTSLEVQLDYMLKELRGDYGAIWCLGGGYSSKYRMTLAAFKQLKDVDMAADTFCAMFERAGIPRLEMRRTCAHYFYNNDKGEETTEKPDVPLTAVPEPSVPLPESEKPENEKPENEKTENESPENESPEDTDLRIIEDGQYLLIPRLDTGCAMAVESGAGYSGANIVVTIEAEKPEFARFEVQYAGKGYYRIRNVGSGLAMDVFGASGSGSSIVQGNVHSGDNQMFRITGSKDEGYYLSPKHAPKCFVIVEGGLANGTANVGIREGEPGKAGCWYFTSVDALEEDQKKDQTISAKNFSKKIGNKAFSLKAATSGDGKLTYASDNKAVATVSSKGKITIKGVGIANITITAQETDTCRKAEKTITITVKPKPTSLSSLKNSSAKKLKITWKKNADVDGYEIEVATKKSFSGAKTYNVSSYKTVSKKITVKKGSTYYVRIRTVASGIRSSWSGVKKLKITK